MKSDGACEITISHKPFSEGKLQLFKDKEGPYPNSLKVGRSTSKQIFLIFVNDILSKMMKNVFYFI